MSPNKHNSPHRGAFLLRLRDDTKTKLDLLVLNVLPFVIACPHCDSAVELIKAGRDHQHKHHPQRYQCKRCQKRFYAHTSRLLVSQVLTVLLDALIAHVFRGVSVLLCGQVAPAGVRLWREAVSTIWRT